MHLRSSVPWDWCLQGVGRLDLESQKEMVGPSAATNERSSARGVVPPNGKEPLLGPVVNLRLSGLDSNQGLRLKSSKTPILRTA